MGQLQVVQAELLSARTMTDKVLPLLIQNIFILVRNCEENLQRTVGFSQIRLS